MSSFLSNKFLQFHAAAQQPKPTIDADLFCITCGYNLRGLRYGHKCPECGKTIRSSPKTTDMLINGSPGRQQAIRLGLMLCAGVLIAVAVARLWLFGALVFAGWSPAQNIYLWMGTAVSVAWIVGVFLLTPLDFDEQYIRWRWFRRAARWSQLLWIPAYMLWLLAELGPLAGSPGGDTLAGWSIFLRGLAGIGALIFAAWLMQLAIDAELENSARWLNLSIWLLPVPTLLLANLPAQMQWIFLVLIGMILLMWCWFVFLMGWAILGMQRHVDWAIRLGRQAQGRDERIEQTRRSLQQAADHLVRTTPAETGGDLPVTQKK